MTAIPGRRQVPPRSALLLLVALAGIVAVGASVRALVDPLSGVTGTFGAWLVTASSLLILGATLLIGYVRLPGALRGLLAVLIVLGVVGTFAAAWLMMQWTLLAAMAVLALLGLLWLASGPRGTRA
jgi:hypothetical protein